MLPSGHWIIYPPHVFSMENFADSKDRRCQKQTGGAEGHRHQSSRLRIRRVASPVKTELSKSVKSAEEIVKYKLLFFLLPHESCQTLRKRRNKQGQRKACILPLGKIDQESLVSRG